MLFSLDSPFFSPSDGRPRRQTSRCCRCGGASATCVRTHVKSAAWSIRAPAAATQFGRQFAVAVCVSVCRCVCVPVCVSVCTFRIIRFSHQLPSTTSAYRHRTPSPPHRMAAKTAAQIAQHRIVVGLIACIARIFSDEIGSTTLCTVRMVKWCGV